MNFEEFLEKYQKVPVVEFPNQVPENPVVSVCVQTYQHAPFIRECLEGILMQEIDLPFEILLGEDESNDGTREICKEYAQKYPDKIRLFLHRRENNIEILGSPTGRFNFLYNLFSSNGKYIAICEGDDYWTDPTKLQKQYNFLEDNPNFTICGHDAYIIRDGKIIRKSKLPDGQKRDFSSGKIQYGIFVLTLTSFFKKIQNIPKEAMNMVNLDTFLFIYLGQFGDYKYMDNIKPACYRLHSKGIWSAKSRDWQEMSDLNTQFWISKYFANKGKNELQDHYGINVTRKSLSYLVHPSLRNYVIIFKHMLYIKFPTFTKKLFSIKTFFKR